MVAPSSKFYGKTWLGLGLNTGKRFFVRFDFKDKLKLVTKGLFANVMLL